MSWGLLQFIIVCGYLVGLCICGAIYEVETNSIHITEPPSLVGDYNASIGNMGIPLYGATMLGKVFYIRQEPELCKDFDIKYSAEWARSELPIILLVKRGTCYFLEKAMRAQKAGADAILIYNNIHSLNLITMVAPSSSLTQEYNNLTIPTAFITKEFGEKIVKAIDIQHEDVIMELDWRPSMFNPDDRVEWEFWYTTYNGCANTSYACLSTQKFLQQFQEVAQKLEESETTKFAPHFLFRGCRSSLRGSRYCQNCIKSERYCGSDYILPQYRNEYTQKNVTWQNFRQLCAYQVAQIENHESKWWQFAADFAKYCTMQAGNYTDQCAEKMLKNADIDVEDVRSCMGEIDADEDSDLIQSQIDAKEGKDNVTRGYISMLPTLVVNEEQYKGRLDNNGVLRAICAGFQEGTEPEICLSSNIQQDDCTYDQNMCWTQGAFSACVDTYRGHICKCPKGFEGDGKNNCQDIDECKTDTHGCDHDCINTLGGYKCSCRMGYIMYGGDNSPGVCIPINPCLFNNGGCEDLCIVKAPGKSTCACAQGLKIKDDDEYKCEDIDECQEGLHTCQQTCTNLDPRESGGLKYKCSCDDQEGYIINPNNVDSCVATQVFLQNTGLEEEAKKSGKAGVKVALFIVMAITLVLPLIGFLVYKIIIKEQLRRQVVDVMALYMPLNDENVVKSDSKQFEKADLQIKQVEETNDEKI